MKIIQMPPRNRRYEKAFINFPFRLYKDTPQWVPPLRADMRKIFKPNYSFYRYGEATFFLAVTDSGEVLGRLALANNHRFNSFHKSKTAFFYYFEVINDLSIAQALFSRGFEWTHDQGLDHVLGPKGFTVLDGFGVLVKGYNFRPAFGQTYNPAYYPDFLEAIGFTKVRDIYSGWIDQNIDVPKKFSKAAQLVKKRMGFHIPEFTTKGELRGVIDDIKQLYNDTLARPAGNPPITDEDMETMVNQLMWIADPRLVKIVYKGEKPIGWLLSYPDVGTALQRSKGRLFPFGWLQILRESKRTSWFNLNGIGIIEEWQRLGATGLLYHELQKSVVSSNQYKYAELLQVREDNNKSLMETANVKVNFHKTHRLYERYL